MTSTLPIGILGSVVSLLAATLYQGNTVIKTKSSGLSYQFKEGHFIGRCCWNVATYKWKGHNVNGKIEIKSSKVSLLIGPRSIYRCMLRFEADLAVSVVPFILNSME
jgi:hypothetical protein